MRMGRSARTWAQSVCVWMLLGLVFALGPATVWAQTLESALSPGPLTRSHAKVENDCAECHVRFKPGGQDGRCVACHKDVGKDIQDRSGLHGRQPQQVCRSCHTDHRGRDMNIAPLDQKAFDHKLTDYVLKGKHVSVECKSCHVAGKKFSAAPSDCLSCHRKDDKHKGSLGLECGNCHTERNWKETAKFDHDKSRFPLRGGHVKAECKDCHTTAQYKDTPTECVACHRKDDKHEGTLGKACADCHTDVNWKAMRFDHGRTRFTLRDGHAVPPLKCSSCHRDLRSYRPTAMACVSCHLKDDKHAGQLGDRCDSCHVERGWRVTRFDHSRARFALIGAHVKVECKSCHLSPRFRDAPRDCVGCHQKDDKHKATLGTKCESCHNVRDWRLWTFDHSRQTDYPLEPGHAKVACQACHVKPAPASKSIAPLDRNCLSCHRRDDIHDGAFGARCDQCHSVTRWKQVSNRAKTSRAPTGTRVSLANRGSLS